MKKTISLLCLSMVIATSFAQLKVNNEGRVGIGTLENPSNLLSVGYKGMYGYAAAFKGERYGIFVRNDGENTIRRVGIKISNYINSDTTSIGLQISPIGTTSLKNYGIESFGGKSSKLSIGVLGGLNGSATGGITSGSGIYGSSSTLSTIPEEHTGIYAGYFRGDVRVTGGLYGTLLTPSESSTSALAVETEVLCNSGEQSISDKLKQVQLLQFYRQNQNSVSPVLINEETGVSTTVFDDFHIEDENVDEMEDMIVQTELSSVKYGLAADQLRNVYPELVYEDGNGNLSINYIEMIPLLVQSINELSAKIEELENGNNDDDFVLMSKERGNATDINEVDETEVLSLSQNRPNPFSESTTIEVTVPESTRTAAIFIYDMSGKQEKQISISERGKVSVSVTSEGLTPGMYLYSLIADGKVVSTRKMILTK